MPELPKGSTEPSSLEKSDSREPSLPVPVEDDLRTILDDVDTHFSAQITVSDEAGLTEIGGSDVVTRRVHAAGTTQMANPLATPHVVAFGAAPGTASVFSAPISMPLNHTIHAYAVDVVGSAESSEVVRHDYRLLPYTESGH